MEGLAILKGKRILAVDDEPDVLEIFQESLPECAVTTASDYESAKNLILGETFDLIVLDVMGVNGFALLQEAHRTGTPTAMLTAHAITAESVNRALKLGAVSFLPKEELASLPEHLADILTEAAAGRSHWKKLFERLGPYFKTRLGLTWEELERPPNPPYSY